VVPFGSCVARPRTVALTIVYTFRAASRVVVHGVRATRNPEEYLWLRPALVR
jgi:hypothetical protein